MATLKEALEYASKNPSSDFARQLSTRIKSGAADQEADALGINLAPIKVMEEPEVKSGGFLKRTVDDVKKTVQTAGQDYNSIISGQGNPVLKGIQAAGRAAVGVGQTALATIGQVPGVKQTTEAIGNTVGTGVNAVVDGLSSTLPFRQLASKTQEGGMVDQGLKTVTALGDVAGLVLGGVGSAKTLAAVKTGAGTVVQGLETAVQNAPRATGKLVTVMKDAGRADLTPEKAVGQVIQGSTKDLKAGMEALKSIDTSKVKTFSELDFELDKQIKRQVDIVDTDLGKDPTKTLLDNLTTTKKTKTGGEVSQNYVSDSLNQLDELYTVTGNLVGKADIQDLINIAKTQGLTRLEINDIARNYGQEFGSKAFSKTGEPLTSVNSQMYENIRKGVKGVARAGMNSDEAIKADKLMSSIYSTRNLVRKNMEAVNKLKNRIEERGLFEKVGHGVSKYLDILTGGTIRGLVGGLLPRGAGYKTLNALDLEDLLERNLKIINEAGKAKTKTQFEGIINQLFDGKAPRSDAKKPFVNTQGGSIRISGVNAENIHPDDVKILKKVKKVGKITDLSNADYDMFGLLGERFNISMDLPLPKMKKLIDDILSGKVKVKGTLLPGSLKKRGMTAVNPLTAGAAVGLGAATIANKKK